MGSPPLHEARSAELFSGVTVEDHAGGRSLWADTVPVFEQLTNSLVHRVSGVPLPADLRIEKHRWLGGLEIDRVLTKERIRPLESALHRALGHGLSLPGRGARWNPSR